MPAVPSFIQHSPSRGCGAGSNPFIDISFAARVMIVIYFVFWRFLPEIAAAMQFDTPATHIVVARMVVRLLTDFLMLLPFCLYRFAGLPIGWLHPLVLPTLLSIAKRAATDPATLLVAVTTWLAPDAVPAYRLVGDLPLADRLAVEMKLGAFLLLAQASYIVGFAALSAHIQDAHRIRVHKASKWRFLLIFTASFVVFLLYIQMNGGLIAHFSSLALGRFKVGGDAGHFLVIIALMPFLLSLWYLDNPNVIRKMWFIGLLIAAIFAQYATTGSRSALIIPVVLMLATWMLVNRKAPGLRFGMIGVFVFLSMGTLGEFRSSSFRNEGTVDLGVLTNFDVLAAAESTMAQRAARDEVSGQAAIMYAVPQHTSYLYGVTYVASIAFFVPRAIWPGKPRGPGAHVGAILFAGWDTADGYTGAGYPAGGVGEAYWNFGVPGIVIVHLLYGMFSWYVAYRYTRDPGDPFKALTLLLTMIVLMDASSDSIVGFLQTMVLMYLSWKFVRLPTRRQASFTADAKVEGDAR